MGKPLDGPPEIRRWNLELYIAAHNPGTARRFARDFSDTQTGGLIRIIAFNGGRVEPEHRDELDKVNGARLGSAEKA
jgi:hypothetical protein